MWPAVAADGVAAVLEAAVASGVVEASGVAGAADAEFDAAGAAESLLEEDEFRETTTRASRTIPTTTAIITRLEDLSALLFAGEISFPVVAVPVVAVPVVGSELIDFGAIRVPGVGTGGITIEAAGLFFATFLALFLIVDFFTVFLTARLAVFFTADFLTAFLAEVFLTADFLTAFLAEVFLTADFLTAFLADFFAVFFTATFKLLQMDLQV